MHVIIQFTHWIGKIDKIKSACVYMCVCVCVCVCISMSENQDVEVRDVRGVKNT